MLFCFILSKYNFYYEKLYIINFGENIMINKIEIYRQAIKDWNILIEKYNSIEDKSIENLKYVFRNQSQDNGFFYEISQGVIKAFLISEGENSVIKEPFIIDTGNFFRSNVFLDELIEEIKNIN